MKISVITVCYNAVSTIETSILSVIEQDYENLEYIVIDGGSLDGTKSIIEKYAAHIAFYLSEPDFGMYDAVNKGITQATGDVIGLLHANDRFAGKNILSIVAANFRKFNSDAVYGDLVFINPNEKIVRNWKSKTCTDFSLQTGWMPPHPALYIRKEIYDRYGNYRLDFGTAADYELILRFFYRHKIKTTYVNQIFIKMLTGGISNKNILNHVTGNINDLKAMRRHGLHAPFIASFLKPFQKLSQYFI